MSTTAPELMLYTDFEMHSPSQNDPDTESDKEQDITDGDCTQQIDSLYS
jgi:hypothetical protein